MLKPFSGEKNLCPVEMGPKNGGFWRKWGSKLKILVSRRPKGTSFTGRMPFLPPNQQRQSTEGKLNAVSAAYFPFSKTFVFAALPKLCQPEMTSIDFENIL